MQQLNQHSAYIATSPKPSVKKNKSYIALIVFLCLLAILSLSLFSIAKNQTASK